MRYHFEIVVAIGVENVPHLMGNRGVELLYLLNNVITTIIKAITVRIKNIVVNKKVCNKIINISIITHHLLIF